MKLLSVVLTAFLVSTSAFAAPKKQQQSGPVRINPTSLRTLLLSRNIDIAIALNEVHQAKARVSQARGSLLPSVNLGSVISSGPSFMLTSVNFLLPFLMPSNWMDLKENTHLLRAQGTSYYIAQLNTYASAYSLYLTVIGDIQLRNALQKQYENYKSIEEYLRLPAEEGIISKEEYLQAQAQAELALVQVSQVDELIKREKASVREMLALELNQEIIFEDAKVASSEIEGLAPQVVLDRVHDKSPETAQMNSLITAAEYNKWSKAFSFLSGSSLGMTRPVSGGSFSSVTQSGSVSFGFGYFPALELSNLNIKQLRLRKQELKLEQAQLIESTLGSLQEAQRQYAAAVQAETNLNQVYNAEVMRYKEGITDLLHVLEAGNALTNSVVNRVKAATSVANLRISLHRLTVSDQFTAIEKCEIERRSSGGIRGKLGRIFNPGKDRVTLDQVCGN
ncbi:TolC family protein [Bdellovibrio bacteriovorus]|uniref:TolC family protein n=1 Tax=Bdellovibrio bacteriovorus TaxID=959 RepID=UPI0035A6AFA4